MKFWWQEGSKTFVYSTISSTTTRAVSPHYPLCCFAFPAHDDFYSTSYLNCCFLFHPFRKSLLCYFPFYWPWNITFGNPFKYSTEKQELKRRRRKSWEAFTHTVEDVNDDTGRFSAGRDASVVARIGSDGVADQKQVLQSMLAGFDRDFLTVLSCGWRSTRGEVVVSNRRFTSIWARVHSTSATENLQTFVPGEVSGRFWHVLCYAGEADVTSAADVHLRAAMDEGLRHCSVIRPSRFQILHKSKSVLVSAFRHLEIQRNCALQTCLPQRLDQTLKLKLNRQVWYSQRRSALRVVRGFRPQLTRILSMNTLVKLFTWRNRMEYSWVRLVSSMCVFTFRRTQVPNFSLVSSAWTFVRLDVSTVQLRFCSRADRMKSSPTASRLACFRYRSKVLRRWDKWIISSMLDSVWSLLFASEEGLSWKMGLVAENLQLYGNRISDNAITVLGIETTTKVSHTSLTIQITWSTTFWNCIEFGRLMDVSFTIEYCRGLSRMLSIHQPRC